MHKVEKLEEEYVCKLVLKSWRFFYQFKTFFDSFELAAKFGVFYMNIEAVAVSKSK